MRCNFSEDCWKQIKEILDEFISFGYPRNGLDCSKELTFLLKDPKNNAMSPRMLNITHKAHENYINDRLLHLKDSSVLSCRENLFCIQKLIEGPQTPISKGIFINSPTLLQLYSYLANESIVSINLFLLDDVDIDDIDYPSGIDVSISTKYIDPQYYGKYYC